MDFSVSVILPVINETFSLKQTVEIIVSENPSDICEYLIVFCKKTTEGSLTAIKELQSQYGSKIVLMEQKLPFLGGAVRDALDICKGTHVIMMATDLETDPHLVKEFIALERNNPDTIITATRWKTKGGFSGYDPFKLILNWVFQKFFSALYRTSLSDMTYGFRIFPLELLRSINWEELRHPFLFETVLKPLRLGVKVTEIPTKWEARKEGESQNPFLVNFLYFKTGIKIMFQSKNSIKRKA